MVSENSGHGQLCSYAIMNVNIKMSMIGKATIPTNKPPVIEIAGARRGEIDLNCQMAINDVGFPDGLLGSNTGEIGLLDPDSGV